MATSEKTKRKPTPKGVRISLKILKAMIFPVLLVAGVLVGLRVGYVQFGGGDPEDVMKWETWKHVLDLVFANS